MENSAIGRSTRPQAAWPELSSGWCWPLPPPRLARGAPGACFDGKMHQKNLLALPWAGLTEEGVVVLLNECTWQRLGRRNR